MEEIRSVRKYLEEIFSDIKKELKENEFIRNLVGSEERIESLIEDQRTLISEYIENWKGGAVDFSRRFEELYTRMDVPYAVIAWNIDRIKSRLMEKLIEENYSQEFLLKFKRYLEDIVNQIAKIYLRKDVSVLKNFEKSPFANRLLYSVHRDWFLKIAECVEKDDFTDFPLISAEECKFSEVLEYPESLFVCLDANMCTYVHNLHKLIHDTANTFYAFYTKGAFYQAYRVFKDLTELVAKLLKTVSELYFLAYSDPESNFFRFVSALSREEGYKYVSAIDVIGLKKINRTHGEEVGDAIIREIEKKLRDLTSKDTARTIVVRGSTSNFFMFSKDYSEEEVRKLVEEIGRELHFEFKGNGKKVPIEVTVATLEMEPYTELVESELRDILSYLKEEAKKESGHTSISVGRERLQSIMNWISEKYRNVNRIKTMIEEGEVEVVFHPIVEAQNTKEIVGVEVLARLREEDRLVPTGVFIDLIYELELVEKLDMQVLEKLKEYLDLLKPVKSLFINVSSRSLMSDRYVERLCDFIKNVGNLNIVVELTEQQLFENTEVALRIAQNGHVSIAVDDFGTGYSSLKIVADLVDKGVLKVLKIDGSLIREMLKSRTVWKVVDMVSALSKRLETKTVAEFIESEEDLSAVRSMGINCVQGYYIAKPMTVHDLVTWLKTL